MDFFGAIYANGLHKNSKLQNGLTVRIKSKDTKNYWIPKEFRCRLIVFMRCYARLRHISLSTLCLDAAATITQYFAAPQSNIDIVVLITELLGL